MIVIQGNKQLKPSQEEISKLFQKYTKKILDLGTGDGRFTYKYALKEPKTLCVGVDPIASQMEEYSKIAVKKKVNNLMYVIGSLEVFPYELAETFYDEIYIIFPWGSILKNTIDPNYEKTGIIKRLIKENGVLTIVTGYNQEFEPGETQRLDLGVLDENKIKSHIAPIYKNELGMELLDVIKINKTKLK